MLYALAFGLFLVAAAFALKGISYAATAGDAAFEPPQVCDAACQARWKAYGAQGNKWMEFGFAALAGSVGSVVIAWRLRRGQANSSLLSE
jgi:hypothetical protein